MHLEREEQLKASLDRGEKVEEIPPELYPFEEYFHKIPEPAHEDDWLHQVNESKDTFQVRARGYRGAPSCDLGVEAPVL